MPGAVDPPGEEASQVLARGCLEGCTQVGRRDTAPRTLGQEPTKADLKDVISEHGPQEVETAHAACRQMDRAVEVGRLGVVVPHQRCGPTRVRQEVALQLGEPLLLPLLPQLLLPLTAQLLLRLIASEKNLALLRLAVPSMRGCARGDHLLHAHAHAHAGPQCRPRGGR